MSAFDINSSIGGIKACDKKSPAASAAGAIKGFDVYALALAGERYDSGAELIEPVSTMMSRNCLASIVS